MFGGLASLPLYLQIVKGASPTQAGLLLLPMTLGIMAGSIVLGSSSSPHRAATATSRSSAPPCWRSRSSSSTTSQADTPLWQTMIVMVFFGIGLGFNFQPLTLAVQNAVSPQQIGVATSIGHVHPPDRRHARHGRVPVHPVLHRAGQDRRGHGSPRTAGRLPGGAEGPGQRAVRQGLHAGPAVRRRRRVLQRRPEGQLVPQPPRPPTGQAVPRGLLRLDGPGLPRRGRRDGVRLPGDAVPAPRRAARRLGLLRARRRPMPQPRRRRPPLA